MLYNFSNKTWNFSNLNKKMYIEKKCEYLIILPGLGRIYSEGVNKGESLPACAI